MGYIPRARNSALLLSQALSIGSQHVLGKVDRTITSSLGANERASILRTLSCQDTLKVTSHSLVLTKEITDFATTHTNIPSRHISIGSNMAVQLSYEGLAESHHFIVTLSLGIKVRTTLSPAHGQSSQRVLEDLFESQKLNDRQIDSGMETETSLVWTNSRIVLDTEGTIDLNLALVINPRNTELNGTFWFSQTDHDIHIFRVLLEDRLQRD